MCVKPPAPTDAGRRVALVVDVVAAVITVTEAAGRPPGRIPGDGAWVRCPPWKDRSTGSAAAARSGRR